MAKAGKAAPVAKSGDGRNNGKAVKKRPKAFDPEKRRIVTAK